MRTPYCCTVMHLSIVCLTTPPPPPPPPPGDRWRFLTAFETVRRPAPGKFDSCRNRIFWEVNVKSPPTGIGAFDMVIRAFDYNQKRQNKSPPGPTYPPGGGGGGGGGGVVGRAIDRCYPPINRIHHEPHYYKRKVVESLNITGIKDKSMNLDVGLRLNPTWQTLKL